jgi:hypothetical protein
MGTLIASQAVGQEVTGPATGKRSRESVLPSALQMRVDSSVERALGYLAARQQPNGAFMTHPNGQPGVTALCVMAFLSCGHLPGEGPYGEKINSAIAYILSCRQKSGLISLVEPAPYWESHNSAHTGLYNHAVSALVLCEVYGMADSEVSKKISPVIEKALSFSRNIQASKKTNPIDKGAWRYLSPWAGTDGDICITSWHLMFWRSAKNAGFNVPTQWVDEALDFVKRCYSEQEHVFYYTLHSTDHVYSRGTTGTGILSLSLAGLYDTGMAKNAGNWILEHPFNRYARTTYGWDRFYYAAFYCSQGMYQLGGKYWEQFFPTLATTLVSNQRSDGSWNCAIEPDMIFGDTYTTAMAILALTPENQLLPIFQR